VGFRPVTQFYKIHGGGGNDNRLGGCQMSKAEHMGNLIRSWKLCGPSTYICTDNLQLALKSVL
jgi:hypothetical protein